MIETSEAMIFDSSKAMKAHYKAVKLRLAARSRPLALPMPKLVPKPVSSISVFDQILTLREGKSYAASAIYEAVATVFNIPMTELTGISRIKRVSRARQLIFSMCAEFTGMSSTWIGRLLKKDHSTVLHGCGVVASLPEYFMPLREQVLAILDKK